MSARAGQQIPQAPVYVLTPSRLAYPLTEAAEQVGYSDEVLRLAIRRGELDASYGTSRKPVIRATELLRWLDSLPTEKPEMDAA